MMSAWTPGLSWLHYDYKQDISYVYINIPKNASSWMKENFGGFEYDWHNNRFTKPVTSEITIRRGLIADKKYLVILRDPLSRWISGFAQNFWGWDPRLPEYYANTDPKLWFEKIWYDDHTRPQIDFIHGLDQSRTIWFDCNKNLVDNVKTWIKDKFDHVIKNLDDDLNNTYNVSSRGKQWPTTGITQQQIIDQVKSVLDHNTEYQQRLLDFYQRDIELRAHVEFYGTR